MPPLNHHQTILFLPRNFGCCTEHYTDKSHQHFLVVRWYKILTRATVTGICLYTALRKSQVSTWLRRAGEVNLKNPNFSRCYEWGNGGPFTPGCKNLQSSPKEQVPSWAKNLQTVREPPEKHKILNDNNYNYVTTTASEKVIGICPVKYKTMNYRVATLQSRFPCALNFFLCVCRVPTFFLWQNSLTFPVFFSFVPDFYLIFIFVAFIQYLFFNAWPPFTIE